MSTRLKNQIKSDAMFFQIVTLKCNFVPWVCDFLKLQIEKISNIHSVQSNGKHENRIK